MTVTPNVSHHIKLAIADTDDDLLDSAVFLEASSFTSGECTIPPPTNLQIRPTGNPDGPVTGIDFLDLSWTPPAPVPPSYFYAINGDEAQTTQTPSVLNVPPRGSNDPILLKVRSACANELFSDVAAGRGVADAADGVLLPAGDRCRRDAGHLHGHERSERDLVALDFRGRRLRVDAVGRPYL